jgi:hypothetical protein
MKARKLNKRTEIIYFYGELDHFMYPIGNLWKKKSGKMFYFSTTHNAWFLDGIDENSSCWS